MAEDRDTGDKARKGPPLKMMMMIAAVLVVEAVAIIGVFMLVGGPPDVSASSSLESIELTEDQKIVEVPVLEAKLPNSTSGVTYVYETEIFAQVKMKYAERVSLELEQFQNEIRSEISAIWKSAEPHQFREANLESLTRKVYALLNDRFDVDKDSGDPIISKCVIVMGTGFRVEG